MRLEALLRAHGFMKVERPPQLWAADTEDTRFVPLLGEMLAASLARGGVLEQLTLNASNVVVEEDAGIPAGEYVAISVKGEVKWDADATWRPAAPWRVPHLADLTSRLEPAGVRFAYIRKLPLGSITVFLPRAPGEEQA
jgi:hypothetical protein